LIDAVYAANFIPEDKTARLIDKIAALAGDAKAEVLKRNIICYDTAKHCNKYILYSGYSENFLAIFAEQMYMPCVFQRKSV